jgi:hypothetical protein
MRVKLPRRLQGLAYILAPAALVFGVALQRYNVEVHEQSPWIGGGFGMFSTIDAPGSRMVRAYVLTNEGPALIIEPRFSEPKQLINTQPTERRLEVAARHLAAQEWRVFGEASYDELEPYLPDLLQRYLRYHRFRLDSQGGEGGEMYPGHIAFRPRQIMPRSPADEVEVGGVRLEVWRPVFAKDANVLSWELIRAATARTVSAD